MIKVKTTKECHQCGDTFNPFRTTDKHCSLKCKLEAGTGHRSTEKKQRKPINKFSKKRLKQNQEYLSEREKFLLDPQNQICPITGNQTTEVHHSAGRIGKLLLYVPYWIAVSRSGHNWIHDNPKESYKNGYLIKQHSIA